MTHLCLLLLSRQAPHTMPTMSSTPRAPATKPPRNRPTPVALLESLLTGPGLTPSASTAGCGRVIDIVQEETTVCVEVAIAMFNQCQFIDCLYWQFPAIHVPSYICRPEVVGSLAYYIIYRISSSNSSMLATASEHVALSTNQLVTWCSGRATRSSELDKATP